MNIPKRVFYGDTGNSWLHTIRICAEPPLFRNLIDGERRCGAYILPPFQRNFVWSSLQQERLIESIYMGLPIGAIIVNFTEKESGCNGWLLDGQQRMTTIYSYMNGEFPVYGSLFSELTNEERNHFYRIGITFIQTDITDPVLCEDLYNRLAYGGTNHLERKM